MANRGGPQSRRGMTLVEFVSAISVAGILIVGIHSSIFISLKSMPASDGAAATALQANRLLDALATELESALYITELTATSIAFSVPDRNGAHQDSEIHEAYGWGV